jgi:hypothetical protein
MLANNATYRNMEGSRVINRTEHVYTSTMEVMYKWGEEGKDVPPGNSQGSRNAHGVPG